MKTKKPLTIIIADDEKDDRELMEYLFNHNDKFEVIGCYDSGLQVVEQIITNKQVPDILLIDRYMPLLSGTEVITRLEENDAAPDMNIFVISGIIDHEEVERHSEKPMLKFIKKPASLVALNDLPGVILESLHYRNNTKV